MNYSDLYFTGLRLEAETCLHSLRLLTKDLSVDFSYRQELFLIAQSYGLDVQPSLLSQAELESQLTDAHNTQDCRSILQAKRQFQEAFSRFSSKAAAEIAQEYPYMPDSYALVIVTMARAILLSPTCDYARVIYVLNKISHFFFSRYPRRPDLLQQIFESLGDNSYLKHLSNRHLNPAHFYSRTTHSLVYLQELWAKGRYEEIMHIYAAFQFSPRPYPSSDFMLRCLTIIGETRLASNLFRSIFNRASSSFPDNSLSSLIFSELGRETIDEKHISNVVSVFRSRTLISSDDPNQEELSCRHSSFLSIAEKKTIAIASADLRNHPVGRFWLPIAQRLSSKFNLVYIDYHPQPSDQIKSQLRVNSSSWLCYTESSNEGLHSYLENLSPDIFLDIGGHTADNRPTLLNNRYATVQASYLGFYGPTYARCADWWIVDEYITAFVGRSYPGAEPLWSLPCPSLCYQPNLHGVPNVEDISHKETAFPVLGSFNHTRKLSELSIARMALLLSENPSFILLFRSHSFYDHAVRARFLQRFLDHGVNSSQLLPIPYASTPSDALKDYNRICLHLDTYPVSGTTTTLDSLAMGIPVLTWPNSLYAGAISAALLNSIGLSRFVATSRQSFLDLASLHAYEYSTANSRRRLARSFRDSDICDDQLISRHFADALAEMHRIKTA